MSFLETFNEHIRNSPDKTAIVFLDPPIQKVTYAELDDKINRCMAYLADLGVQPGDRVALQLPKCLEFILLHLATQRMGAITLPLNTAYPPAELAYFLGDSEAGTFFADEAERGQFESILTQLPNLHVYRFIEFRTPENFEGIINSYSPPSISTDPVTHQADSTILLIYTSGTTGRPRGAEITVGNLTSNLDALHQAWGWRQDDVLLHALPLFHLHGLVVALHGALHAGATVLAMRKFEARQVLHHLVTQNCSVFMGVPTIYQRILALPDAGQFDLSHMRLLTSGSDRLPDELFLAFQKTFGHTLLERYGMTETGMNISNPLLGERRIGSVGLPLPGVEARIVEPETGKLLPDGEIGAVQIRGPNVFKGYWKQPQKTADSFTQDGWLRTGDLGYREPDGYFTLKGRAKDLIITGGLNVYPPEVERVLNDHEAVVSSAVIGCLDVEWGERVIAVVVRQPGETISGDELIQFCRQRLAAYKCPKEIYFTESLPRNAMGKVQKVNLRREICG